MDLDFDILEQNDEIEIEVLEEEVVEEASDELVDEMKELFGSDCESDSGSEIKVDKKINPMPQQKQKKTQKKKNKKNPRQRRKKNPIYPLKTKYKKYVYSKPNEEAAAKSVGLRKQQERQKHLDRVRKQMEAIKIEETETKLRHMVKMHQFDLNEYTQDAAVVERELKKYEKDMVQNKLDHMPKANVQKAFTIEGEVYRPLGAHFNYKHAGLTANNFEMYRVPCNGKLQCCHCTLPILGVPIPLPTSYNEKLDVFTIKLQFCSASCVFGFAAKEFSLNMYPKKTPIIYHMLHKVYGFDITKKIPKAPPPFGILKRYGGHMTDATWRKNVANFNRRTEVVSFPFIPHRWGTADIHRVSLTVRDDDNDYDIVKDYTMRIVDKNIWNLNLDACDLLSTVQGMSRNTGKRKRQTANRAPKKRATKSKKIDLSCFDNSDEKNVSHSTFSISELESSLKSVEDAVRLRNPHLTKNSKSIMQYMIKSKK